MSFSRKENSMQIKTTAKWMKAWKTDQILSCAGRPEIMGTFMVNHSQQVCYGWSGDFVQLFGCCMCLYVSIQCHCVWRPSKTFIKHNSGDDW